MNIFIGCSSVNAQLDKYSRTAEKMADFIVKGGHNLVFGGCDRGLMGKVYSQIIKSQSKKTKIIITIAEAWKDDLKTLTYDEVHMFKTVNERDQQEIDLSDALVFLPGGIGTLEEILMAIETRRSGEHDKPIIIINNANFFENLIEMLNQIYDEGFANSSAREMYFIADTVEEAIKYLSGWIKESKI